LQFRGLETLRDQLVASSRKKPADKSASKSGGTNG
jgi:hypothetical protein